MKLESPIEFVMAQGLMNDARFAPLKVNLDTQVEIRVNSGKQYRLDMLIRCAFTGNGLLVVECDGKDFHSLPWQIARDQQRDKDVRQTFGVNTLRFTGSEINNNLQGCLDTILKHLYRIRHNR